MPSTFTENVHDPEAASVAPDRLITLVACVAVIVPPPQVPLRPLGVATTKPAGSVSLKPTPVNAVPAFGLLIVKLSEAVPDTAILGAPNALMIPGGATTVMLAFEVLPVPPLLEVTCTLLFFTPAVVPCTLTETVHELLVARVPPDRLT